MREKLFSLLLRPYVLAVLPAVIVILALPDLFPKHRLQLHSAKAVGQMNDIVQMADLNHDGEVEIIRQGKNEVQGTTINIYNEYLHPIDQWNLSGDRCYYVQECSFFDYNSNGTDDVWVFTNDEGNILVSIIDINLPTSQWIEKVVNEGYADSLDNDLAPSKILFEDVNGDGIVEAIFSLNAGFTAYPRNLFIWDMKQDTIYQSPYFCNRLTPLFTADIDSNGKQELYCDFSSSGNSTPDAFSCSDYQVSFTVFDHTATPLIKPYTFPSPFGGTRPCIIQRESEQHIAILHGDSTDPPVNKWLTILNNDFKEDTAYYFGHLFARPSLKYNVESKYLMSESGPFYKITGKGIEKITGDFEEPLLLPKKVQLDQDEPYEWLAMNRLHSRLYVFEDEFSSVTTIDIDKVADARDISGAYFDKDDIAHIYSLRQNFLYDFTYRPNPYYPLRLPLYLAIYLALTALLWLLAKGMQYQQKKQAVLEKNIATLQMKAIKNQVDPHFVFNAMNAISGMLLSDQKQEADRFITKFSKFMRQTLSSSDRIITTLEEELKYVDNYLQLQQIRFQHSFTYSIDVNEGIDTQLALPKHILFTYVENAVKHGLYHKNGQGHIQISATRHKNHVWLMVEDNGIGEAAKKLNHPYSSGRGLQIMQDIINLYQKLHGRKIQTESITIQDDTGNPAGMRIIIKLHKS